MLESEPTRVWTISRVSAGASLISRPMRFTPLLCKLESTAGANERYQLGALKAITEGDGGKVGHVKVSSCQDSMARR